MARGFFMRWMGLAGVVGLLAGCEPAEFEESAPLGVKAAVSPVTVAPRAKWVALIFPRESSEEMAVWEAQARLEVALGEALTEVKRPLLNDPPGRQLDLIREAAQAKPLAMVVVAEDPKAAGPVLAQVRDQGTPVVLLERDVPVEGKRLPLVAYPPPSENVDQMIQAAVEEAKYLKLPPHAPAVILANSQRDALARARVAALTAALEKAGVPLLATLPFTSTNDNHALDRPQQVLMETLAARPEIAIVLAEDDQGLNAAVLARKAMKAEDRFVIAGFAEDSKNLNLVSVREAAAVVDRNTLGIARLAVKTALRLARGETLPDRILVENKIRRASGPPNLRLMEMKYKEQMNQRAEDRRTTLLRIDQTR
jgi:ABC-type sugar transport system substrate-binding protein